MQTDIWRARITEKGKTFNKKLPEQEMTTEELILSQLCLTGSVIMIPDHYEYKVMTLSVIIAIRMIHNNEMKQD